MIPRRILLTESMALPIRDAGSKDFSFQKLQASGKSTTLENRSVKCRSCPKTGVVWPFFASTTCGGSDAGATRQEHGWPARVKARTAPHLPGQLVGIHLTGGGKIRSIYAPELSDQSTSVTLEAQTS